MNDALTGGGSGQTPVHPDDLEGLRLRWIRDQGQLDAAELRNLSDGRRWAGTRRTLDELLSDTFLYEVHRRSFGAVWSWAGRSRIRGTSIGIDAHLIPTAVRDALLDARAQLDAAATSSAQCEALARLHHRLAQIHPFTNGNGRTLRLHCDLLARALGLEPSSWRAGDDGARDAYLAALRAADRGDIEPLVQFMWPGETTP